MADTALVDDNGRLDDIRSDAAKANSYGTVDVDAETGPTQPSEAEHAQPTEARPAGVASLGLSPADCAVTVITFVLAVAWVKIVSAVVVWGFVSKALSRKIVHITTGPFFLLTWPLYSNSQQAKYLAALTPAVQGLKLIAIATGLLVDEDTVRAVSRVGDCREVLRGPFYYVLVLLSSTLIYWRHSAVGIVTICIMCGGDGFAEVFGRHFGASSPLPWNPEKSAVGSCAMLLGGSGIAACLLAIYNKLGLIDVEWKRMGPVLMVIVLTCTLVETLPLSPYIDDNLSVPIIAALLGAGFLDKRR